MKLKLKQIRRILDKAERNNDVAEIERMFSLLREQYADEIKKNPNSNRVDQILSTMTQHKCPKDAHQKQKYNSTTQKTSTKSISNGNSAKLGASFTNSYNFMPFVTSTKAMKEPTPQTVDETEKRYSGVLKFNVKLNSPLMTLKAEPENTDKHKEYKALAIGNSVIYPATAVRGSIRHLMTMITGSRLRYLDDEMYLVDDRWSSNDKTQKNLQLALITKVGSRDRYGKVVLGKQKPIKLSKLKQLLKDIDNKRSSPNCNEPIWVKWNNMKSDPQFSFAKNPPNGYNKILKLSGKPVGYIDKKEWIFEPDYSREITLPPQLWVQYMNRYLNSPYSELTRNNIVWLEPEQENTPRGLFIIKDGADVRSIQWSKWGKEGDSLKDVLPEKVIPAYKTGNSKKVDEITDMFGQVPSEKEYAGKAPVFAGRIRPDNLVFSNATNKLQKVTLAPLMRPHAGCKAFYRNSTSTEMKGYKIYHTTKEKGKNAPYNYAIQPVYKDATPQPANEQKVTKTVELLQENVTGSLSISFKALTVREYSLLRLVCSLPQRFGGGKPFGLGLCTMQLEVVLNEFGQKIKEPVENWPENINDLSERVKLYKASQKSVDKLRYPVAVDTNGNTITKAGHIWFSYNASKSKNKGFLKSFPTKDDARKKLGDNLSPQPLPILNTDEVLLYGYDLSIKTKSIHKTKYITDFEPFNRRTHTGPNRRSRINDSPNQESRQRQRDER